MGKNDIDAAKNHFDSIAAIFFGCGDTNPVPLPVYTPDTVVTTAPQVPTQITWTADAKQKDGDAGTVYSLYHLANKRASNYGKCSTLKTSSCSTDKTAQTTSGSVSVADLNTVVSNALSATGGPTAAGVSTIRDSINTINAQAAQRYIARISLDANLPGNGMGGSTKLATVDLPAGTTAGAVPTACGGGSYVPPGAPIPSDGTPTAAELTASLLAKNAGANAVAAANIGKNIAVVAPTTYVAPSGGACGSSAGVCGTFINAP